MQTDLHPMKRFFNIQSQPCSVYIKVDKDMQSCTCTHITPNEMDQIMDYINRAMYNVTARDKVTTYTFGIT